MSKRVEIEQKFYCSNQNELLKLVNKNKLQIKSEKNEIDDE